MNTVTSPDGTTLAYDQVGSGPAVIFVPGVFNLRSTGDDLAAELSADHTVITYDRRARGDSTDTRPYEIAKEVADLQTLINATGGSAAVFGYSSGAILALYAAAAGTAIQHLFLYEPPFGFDRPETQLPTNYPDELQAMLDEGRPGDVVATHQTRGIGLPEQMVAGIRQSPMWPVLEAMAQSVVYDATIVARLRVPTEAMTRVSTPTTILYGEQTWPQLAASARQLGEVMDAARLVAVPGGENHTIPPAAAAAAVREALLRQARALQE